MSDAGWPLLRRPATSISIRCARSSPRAVTHGHSDHARAGHDAVLATPETLDIMGCATGRTSQAARQAIALRRGNPRRRRRTSAFIRPAMCSARPRSRSSATAAASSSRATTSAQPTRPARRSSSCRAMPSSPRRRSACRCSAIPTRWRRSAKLLASLALFPERAPSRRRLCARQGAARHRPAPCRGLRPADLSPRRDGDADRYYASRHRSWRGAPGARAGKAELAGEIVICPPSALQDRWTRRFPEPVAALASGWMRVRARARQRGVELPLVVSDHCRLGRPLRDHADTGCSELWVTHGEEDALVHWATTHGLAARPLHLIGYGEEEVAEAEAGQGHRRGHRSCRRRRARMNRFRRPARPPRL